MILVVSKLAKVVLRAFLTLLNNRRIVLGVVIDRSSLSRLSYIGRSLELLGVGNLIVISLGVGYIVGG